MKENPERERERERDYMQNYERRFSTTQIDFDCLKDKIINRKEEVEWLMVGNNRRGEVEKDP